MLRLKEPILYYADEEYLSEERYYEVELIAIDINHVLPYFIKFLTGKRAGEYTRVAKNLMNASDYILYKFDQFLIASKGKTND